MRVCYAGQVRNLAQLDPGSLSPLSMPNGVQVCCRRLWVDVFGRLQEKFLPGLREDVQGLVVVVVVWHLCWHLELKEVEAVVLENCWVFSPYQRYRGSG